MRVCPPLRMPITRSRSPGSHNFCPTRLQIRGSHDLLPLGFNYFLEQLTELRGTLTFTSLLRDLMKETDGHRAKSGRFGAQKLLSPGSRGVSPSCTGICPLTWTLPKPHALGIFVEASFPARLPSLEKAGAGGPAENAKILILAWPLQ